MLLKQGVSKEEMFKFILLNVVQLLVLFAVIVLLLSRELDSRPLIITVSVLWFPLFFAQSILGIFNLEWFLIYEDRIECRCLFYVKNVVYFQNVISIENKIINLTARGMEKEFFILQDGRKNTSNILGRMSCYNRKKYSFRIYKTKELETLLKDKFGIFFD